jgi:hypothetical protein
MSDNLLISDAVSLFARHIAENYSETPEEALRVESRLQPTLKPSNLVDLTAPSRGITGRALVNGVTQTLGDDGRPTPLTLVFGLGARCGQWLIWTAYTAKDVINLVMLRRLTERSWYASNACERSVEPGCQMMTEENALAALRTYARETTEKFRTKGKAHPEDQLKSPVERLIRQAGALVGQTIVVNTESPVDDVGRPDLAINADNLLTGYVELKAAGDGADVRRFNGRNKRQRQKFQALPNLVYTDRNDWILCHGGKPVQRVTLSGDFTADSGARLTVEDADAFLRLLRNFLSWAPSSPRRLAEVLAPLCQLLREDVRQALHSPNSALSDLAREWRSYLFPEANDDQLADAYAQTLTYALLLARLSGADLTETHKAEDALRARRRLLAQVLYILGQPAAREEIALGIDLLERTIAAVDSRAMGQSSADPWLHCYKDFLAAYDPKLCNERGVYYTPIQVVKAQVRLVADLLQRRLDMPLTYAEEGVVLLDPATGIGTYPLTTLQHGLDAVEAAYGPDERSRAASQMARNIHASEKSCRSLCSRASAAFGANHRHRRNLASRRSARLPHRHIGIASRGPTGAASASSTGAC